MKIGITGYREFNDYQLFCSVLTKYKPTEIISGGATGADILAKKYASIHNIHFVEFLPLFKTNKNIPYHVSHFHIRNKQIVNASDILIAFLHSSSKGTLSTIKYAKKTGVHTIIINIP